MSTPPPPLARANRSSSPRPGRVALAGLVALLALSGRASFAADEAEGLAFFESKIRPVLVARCYKCHSPQAPKLKAGLRLDTREGMRAGGDSGPAIEPGQPDASLLIRVLEHTSEIAQMPPGGKLSDATLADFRRWIEMGAPDPREGAGQTPGPTASDAGGEEAWWSLLPLERPVVATSSGDSSIRNPIDAFIASKLASIGLQAAPEADRRALIRRVTFDLTGLPPTPEEIAAFEADPAPDAYERLVDRLLASPHHGERQARLWMDLAHFAETHGHDQDRVRPNAWPYRDYLIESFNRDTPYARFVQEQVAADAMFPDEPRLTVALGFLAAGPWDESSLRDIREDTLDREIGRYLDRDDVVTTVMSTFVSTTVHCARCHDHKFDPIPTEDYYALQAVFSGVDRANRAYDTDPEVARRRRELKRRQKALEAKAPEILDELRSAATQAEVAAWEGALRAGRPEWDVLAADRLEAASGVTLAVEPDGSVLASGDTPAQVTYTFEATVGASAITAIRLEVIPDDRLPHRGPGRNPNNGNLHLTEFRVRAVGPGASGTSRPVAVVAARSDFDQEGWGIAAAIDGNGQTAWGIHPEEGKPHEAVFELEPGFAPEPGSQLVIELEQTHPAAHNIGRFRLSATNAPPPVRTEALPRPLAALLDVPQAQRTPEQTLELAALYLGETIRRELAELPEPRHVYAAASDFEPDASHRPAGKPRMVHVLRRGDIKNPMDEAAPGSLECVEGLPARFEIGDRGDEGARRAALARWITDANNPLTWRSIVNRAWLQHFGRGLVNTPSDFGRMGDEPSHPELLDWLAAEFRDGGGSLKALHRLIVTSAAYRRSSRHDEHAAGIDADNALLWRQNRRRLDAESTRDAILLASGVLDRTMGGPSVQQFVMSPGVHVTPVVDYSKFVWGSPGSGRRGVYRFLFRTLPDPFLDRLDAADASQLTATRSESVSPLQALALMNNPFMIWASGRFADRLEAETSDRAEQVRRAFLTALGRPPSEAETRAFAGYADEHGLPAACRLLMNASEFLFVD